MRPQYVSGLLVQYITYCCHTHFLHCHVPHYDTIDLLSSIILRHHRKISVSQLCWYRHYALDPPPKLWVLWAFYLKVGVYSVILHSNNNNNDKPDEHKFYLQNYSVDRLFRGLADSARIPESQFGKDKGIMKLKSFKWTPRLENIQQPRRTSFSYSTIPPRLPESAELTLLRTVFHLWITIFTWV